VGKRRGKEKTFNMKTRKMFVEVICFILLINFFYEGIYKIAYIHDYEVWLANVSLLKNYQNIFAYFLPIGEILLALCLLIPNLKIRALYAIIVVSILFVLWILSVFLFKPQTFWPFHALWVRPSWMQKMLISLSFSWLSFIAIVLSKRSFPIKKYFSNALRNTPANVSR
jgi:hypothetical protein